MTDKKQSVFASLTISLFLLISIDTAAFAQSIQTKLANVAGKTLPTQCDALEGFKGRFQGICKTESLIPAEIKFCSDFYNHIMAMNSCPQPDYSKPTTVEGCQQNPNWFHPDWVEDCIRSTGSAGAPAQGLCKKWRATYLKYCKRCAVAANAEKNPCPFLVEKKKCGGQNPPTCG